MKVADFLASRQEAWRKLVTLCQQLERVKKRKLKPEMVSDFAARYRAACADLALADAYQLPPGAVQYLHQLVGRAHNQLYRTRKLGLAAGCRILLHETPARLVRDRVLWLAMAIFWGVWILSMGLAYYSSQFAHTVLGEAGIEQLQESFAERIDGRDADGSGMMVGFYIMHNTGIGLQCFAFGTLLGIGGLFATVFNAAFLGASFGFMLTVPERDNFFHFVTAHGPFELTAIVLSAAAGMRLGFSQIDTGGLGRLASLRRAGKRTMPTMIVAIVLFALAGLIEGFLSPSAAPYWVKAAVAIASALLLVFYLFGLGLRGSSPDAI